MIRYGLLYRALALVAMSNAAMPAMATEPAPQRVYLWDGLYEGMSAAEVAAYFDSEGVRTVSELREGVPVTIVEEREKIFGKKAEVALGFNSKGLVRVEFHYREDAAPKYKSLKKNMVRKYGDDLVERHSEIVREFYASHRSEIFHRRGPVLVKAVDYVRCPVGRHRGEARFTSITITARNEPIAETYGTMLPSRPSCAYKSRKVF